ncbi:MAG TPA: hypothetical protein PLB45_01490 [Bacilli bacterium]|jgi:hypothetical protein|nr:hypothetical protein [Bacilli bacterium]HPZ23880.1 hypothetical protein [Bacilli bacterium]HQC83531.1 hypothetical protein [Bacilli bacterium]
MRIEDFKMEYRRVSPVGISSPINNTLQNETSDNGKSTKDTGFDELLKDEIKKLEKTDIESVRVRK